MGIGMPQLTMNRPFVMDLMAAQTPCFALGYVGERGVVSGCMALRPARPIPPAVSDQGFRFGHVVLGTESCQVLQFVFSFYGHATYHGLVNPTSPIVQAVIRRMVETEDYFFFAINPDQSVTAFRSRLEDGDLAGLRTNQERFGDGQCSPAQYEQVVQRFVQAPTPPGQVMTWVCRDNGSYLNLTTQRLDLNPA